MELEGDVMVWGDGAVYHVARLYDDGLPKRFRMSGRDDKLIVDVGSETINGVELINLSDLKRQVLALQETVSRLEGR